MATTEKSPSPKLGADRVAAWLEKNERDQLWLARSLSVAQATVSRWMSGHRDPLAVHCVAMEKLTGVAVRDWTIASKRAA